MEGILEMRILRGIGWLLVPFIMLPLRWKVLGTAGKVIGSIWALAAIVSILSPKQETKPVTVPASTVSAPAPTDTKAADDAKKKAEEEAKAKADAEAKAKADQEAKAKAEEEAKQAATPEAIATKAVHKAFGATNSFDKGDSIVELNFNKDNGFLNIKVFAQDNFTENLIKKGMWMNAATVLKELKDNQEIKTVYIGVVYPLQDAYGKSSNDQVMKMTFGPETRSKINWDNFMWNNIPKIAEGYWEHPVVRKIDTN
jgi:hypothetical protein